MDDVEKAVQLMSRLLECYHDITESIRKFSADVGWLNLKQEVSRENSDRQVLDSVFKLPTSLKEEKNERERKADRGGGEREAEKHN